MRNFGASTIGILILLWSCTPQGGDVASEDTQLSPNIFYDESGKQIAQIAQAELFKNLNKAIDEGGTVHAIQFCNQRISSIMDSLSEVHHATISRISLKTRNPKNSPDTELEEEVLNFYNELKGRQQFLSDTLYESDHRAVYFKPIVITNQLCLQCHGPARQIDTTTFQKISELYPEDRATGYDLGDFRGAWKVEFEKHSK